jgi:hypothetical protein
MGVVLSVLAAVAGSAVYFAAPDNPPDADAVSVPPLVRAEPIEPPPANVVRVATQALTKPLAAAMLPPDRPSLVRELQKALARAGCYSGPINGIWSEASKDAMRGFMVAVNAQLPVDNPDEAFVALVESNDTATCSRERTIYTGALNTPSPAPTENQWHPGPQMEIRASEPSPSSPPVSAAVVDNRSMIERTWAAPEMLVPPNNIASDAANTPASPSTRIVDVTADSVAPILRTDDPPRSSSVRFAGDKVLPNAQPIVSEPDTPAAASHPQKTAQKRSRAAKRKAAKQDVQTSISKSFYSIQKSLSSMFE